VTKARRTLRDKRLSRGLNNFGEEFGNCAQPELVAPVPSIQRLPSIKHEVFQLVETQIETFRQEGRLTDSALLEYHARSERITELYGEIDRIVRARFDSRTLLAC
jgi:hypothetical protein